MNRVLGLSLREVLLLLTTAAIGCGWLVDSTYSRRRAAAAEELAEKWRDGAGTLERLLRKDGYSIQWHWTLFLVRVSSPASKGGTVTEYVTTGQRPSDPLEWDAGSGEGPKKEG